ncbi:hypothetical protein H6G89_28875 [Oscillatoria sp. FACHB-1407]|uniref:hypothetical protein n=1 Tax=Oscillatoria sp. FACHB-1407 TaxID=2692847 RepID=UPI00168438DB|nr:hypothetical protein [Oscillatoria sp. FACHB-1407]MBD2465024.1 hypothetical protein [Oscillatoria sp. FACHB-1407]
MFSTNPHPSRPAGTRFTIRKSERALEIHPPRPETLSFEQRLWRGAVPFKTRFYHSFTLVALMLVIQALLYPWFWWAPLILLGILSPAMLIWLMTPAKSTHLYLNAYQGWFKICRRSLESSTHPDQIIASELIADLQSVTASQHSRGRYGATRSVTLHAKQTYFLDWSLTAEESLWIVGEIQSWLEVQKQ